jgi:hypothetical protein
VLGSRKDDAPSRAWNANPPPPPTTTKVAYRRVVTLREHHDECGHRNHGQHHPPAISLDMVPRCCHLHIQGVHYW